MTLGQCGKHDFAVILCQGFQSYTTLFERQLLRNASESAADLVYIKSRYVSKLNSESYWPRLVSCKLSYLYSMCLIVSCLIEPQCSEHIL